MLALTFLLAALAAVTVGATRTPADTRDFEASWRYSHQAAKRYRAQRDVLQHRLTVRVLQVRALRRQLRLKVPKRDVSYAIRLAATAYGVSETEMHRVASCESGHFAFARNGIYRGVFQEGPMFERGRFGRAGFSVFDAVANAMTAAETVSREGWSQWSCKPG